MDREKISLNRCATNENTIQSFVSFRKFIHFLEEQVLLENKNQYFFYRFILNKINALRVPGQGMEIEEIGNYAEIFKLVAAIIFPLAGEKAIVALTSASTPDVFYAKHSFYELFSPFTGKPAPQELIDEAALNEIHTQFQYNLALHKISGYILPERKEIIHSFFNEATGLYQYFRIDMDKISVNLNTLLKGVCYLRKEP